MLKSNKHALNKGQNKGTKNDEIQSLKEALNYAVFIPFSVGTMTEFGKALYAVKNRIIMSKCIKIMLFYTIIKYRIRLFLVNK